MIRTWDPQIRNLVLYPAELPGQFGVCDPSTMRVLRAHLTVLIQCNLYIV
jgi:hypothetical protein